MTDLLSGLGAGVVVVTYRSAALLEAQLRAAPWLDSPRTVVVDNTEDAAGRAALDEAVAATRVRLLRLDGNPGFGAACNRGMAALAEAGAEVGVLLNPDAAIAADDLTRLVAEARDRRTSLVAPRVLDGRGGTWFAGGALDLRRGRAEHRPGARDWLTAACLAAPLPAWERVGGFDEGYFLYWEDVDLSTRWRTVGELVVLDDVVAVHDVGGTQTTPGGAARPGKSATYLRQSCRNRLRYAARHLDRRARVRWALGAPRYAVRTWRRRAAGEPGAVRAVVGGTAAGLRELLRAGPR